MPKKKVWSSKVQELRKFKRRIREQVIQATGAKKHSDENYNTSEKHFKAIEESIRSTEVAMAKWAGTLQAFCDASRVLSEELARQAILLSDPCDMTDNNVSTTEKEIEGKTQDRMETLAVNSCNLLQAMIGISEQVFQPIQQMFVGSILQPVMDTISEFPRLHQQIDRRKRKLLYFDHYRRKVGRLQAEETQPSKVQKREVKLAEKSQRLKAAEEELEGITKSIMGRFKEIKQNRCIRIEQEIGTLVACQRHLYAKSSELIDELCPQSRASACAMVDLTIGTVSAEQRAFEGKIPEGGTRNTIKSFLEKHHLKLDIEGEKLPNRDFRRTISAPSNPEESPDALEDVRRSRFFSEDTVSTPVSGFDDESMGFSVDLNSDNWSIGMRSYSYSNRESVNEEAIESDTFSKEEHSEQKFPDGEEPGEALMSKRTFSVESDIEEANLAAQLLEAREKMGLRRLSSKKMKVETSFALFHQRVEDCIQNGTSIPEEEQEECRVRKTTSIGSIIENNINLSGLSPSVFSKNTASPPSSPRFSRKSGTDPKLSPSKSMSPRSKISASYQKLKGVVPKRRGTESPRTFLNVNRTKFGLKKEGKSIDKSKLDTTSSKLDTTSSQEK